MASPRTVFLRPAAALLLLVAAALLVSSCHASLDAAAGGEMKASVSVPITSSNPSKCEWMPQCNVDKCTERCVGIGLGNEKGFCSFHNMQFECCCPIVPPRAATSSAKQV
ncbi:unnamed protein product [Alopecurus aequalis]